MTDQTKPTRRKRRGDGQRCFRGHVKVIGGDGRAMCPVCAKRHRRAAIERVRHKRLSERRLRIRSRPRPVRTDRVWAAGHFEGEGTISLCATKRTHISVPRVLLTSTDRSVVGFFAATWPGYVHSHLPNTPEGRCRRAYTWEIKSCDAIEGFLLDIRPFLKRARVRAKTRLMLEDVRERMENRHTETARQRKRVRMAKMRALNRRGRDRAV